MTRDTAHDRGLLVYTKSVVVNMQQLSLQDLYIYAVDMLSITTINNNILGVEVHDPLIIS